MEKGTKIFVILIVLLMISLCFNVIQYIDGHETEIKIETKTDTLVKIDTVEKVLPDYREITKTETKYEKVPAYITVNDTIMKMDTVIAKIAYETKNYKEDSLYDLQITGHKATLDYIKVFPKTNYITKEITVTKTKRNHFNVTVGVGGGYGIVHKQPDIFVGAVVGYSF